MTRNIFIWLNILSSLCGLSLALIAHSGIHFKEILNKNDFFPSVKNVKFTVSEGGLPDMPGWMKLEQKVSLLFTRNFLN